MTIITHPISEKKLAKDKEPLFDDVNPSAPSSADVESNATPLVVTMRSRAQRVSSLTTVCVFITALFVLTTGIIGGVYVYRQFEKYRLRQFRGWCSVPYREYDISPDALTNGPDANYESESLISNQRVNKNRFGIEEMINNIAAQMKKTIDGELKVQTDENDLKPYNSFFEEEFDIDIEEGRCFVMPLNRTMVLPPQNLYDLVLKMRSGYYDIDTEIIREKYRVVTPPITDPKSLGYYIGRECGKLPTYKLEKITSPVFKRSINDIHNKNVVFSEFAGNKISEIEIVNLHVAKGKQ